MTTLKLLQKTRAAMGSIAAAGAEKKNALLLAMADSLEAHCAEILAANAEDMAAARGRITDVMLDRLKLDENRIAGMANGIRDTVRLPDHTGRVLSEGVHDALPLGDGGNLLRVGPADNGFLDFRRHGHHFENTDPAQIARVPAVVAAFPAPEGCPFRILDPEKPEQGAGRIIGLGAMGAHFADKALGKRAEEHGSDEIRLDVHFHEPGNRAGRVVGVQRGKDQMSRDRGADGDLRRVLVADLPDHDDIGILSENTAQRGGES